MMVSLWPSVVVHSHLWSPLQWLFIMVLPWLPLMVPPWPTHGPFLALHCGPSLVPSQSWPFLVVLVLCGCGPASWIQLDLDLTSSSIPLFLISFLHLFAVVLLVYTYYLFNQNFI